MFQIRPKRPIITALIISTYVYSIPLFLGWDNNIRTFSSVMGVAVTQFWAFIALSAAIVGTVSFFGANMRRRIICEMYSQFTIGWCITLYAGLNIYVNGISRALIASSIIIACGIGCIIRAWQLVVIWKRAVDASNDR